MNRSFQTIQNVAQADTNFLGIGPTTAQAQGAPNAQAEQATQSHNELSPTPAFKLTEKGLFDSLRHHGYFYIPFELTTRIIHSFPSIESLVLRTVSKPFCRAWEEVAKNQLFNSNPTIHHLALEQGCHTLHEQQQAEIKYLIENKTAILEQNNNDPRLITAFAKLALLENNSSLVAYHAKEKCLNSLNETIIRVAIAKTQQRNDRTSLDLNGRHLTRFPSGIISDVSLGGFWKKIIVLHVSGNQLTTLPDDIGQCIALLQLDVRNNQLTTLPDTIGQCAALQVLIAYNNQLTTLPDTIGQCAALQKLFACNNQLTTLPDTIGQCTVLKQLYISNNQLITLPDTIGHCVALQSLGLSDNKLTILPDTLRQCAALRYLCLTQNKLTALPNGLKDDIFYEFNNKISKAQCLALQKKAPINTEEAQERSPMRFR